MMMNDAPHKTLLEEYFNSLSEIELMNLADHYLIEEFKHKDKKKIISQLITFLADESNQQHMIRLLDQDDLLILNAVILSNEMKGVLAPHDKLSLLSKLLYPFKKYYIETQLQNLKDRLWLYNNIESGYTEVNPLLHHKIQDMLLSAPIFPKTELNTPPVTTHITLSFVQALLTFINQHRHTKNTTLDSSLTAIFQEHVSQILLEESIKALKQLSIVEIEPEVHISMRNLKALLELSPHEQLAEIYATVIMFSFPLLHKNALKTLLAHLFLSPYAFHEFTIIRLYALHYPQFKHAFVPELLQALEHYDIIHPLKENTTYCNHIILDFHPLEPKIEGNLTFFYPCDQIIQLPIIFSCKLLSYDIFSQYEFSKHTVQDAINQGVTQAELRYFFLEYCQPPIHLNQTIEYWLTEDKGLHIYQGYVIHLASRYCHLLKNTFFLETFVDTIISTDVLLLKKAPDKELEDFFLSQNIQAPSMNEHKVSYNDPTQSFTKDYTYIPHVLEENQAYTPSKVHQQEVFHSTHNTAQRLFLERKLILTSQQLEKISHFKQQASGLDFHAKIRLVELAIKDKKDLLIQIKQTQTQEEFYIKPISYDKKNSQYVKAYEYRRKQLISFDIRAIVHLEVIKRSLLQ